MTAEREALEAYGRFVDAVAQEFAEKGLEQARAIFAFHLRAVSQALANPATIRDTDEDAVDADMRAYAEAAMQHGWKTAVDAAVNGRLVDLYARDWFEQNPPKCARLASSTPAEPDEPTEAMIEALAFAIAPHLQRTTPINPDCDDVNAGRDYAMLVARHGIKAMSQRKAQSDASGERKC